MRSTTLVELVGTFAYLGLFASHLTTPPSHVQVAALYAALTLNHACLVLLHVLLNRK